ncbi:hydrogenase nickel incorporation protein HypB [Rhodococcus spongiicola]|uniref:Hydrogenase accessory protein HypB n=1 Tax=Rhodococcus spongiicola TaxID=2487352 RepID=A0A3S3B2Q8_9NOCA|nr:hydrogenase nickel incorporation protein HypB [Rhodococcus spongiicola]RVW01787.1 hydrogenase accessory protein HypB [Rhodococcus spongiicola]
MCSTCGCGKVDEPTEVRLTAPDARVPHQHDHSHTHAHSHGHAAPETVTLEQKILAKNDQLAEENRTWLADRGIAAFNLMSSPGSGKTTLLERTLRDLQASTPVSVIEGDQETLLDADRIRATGCAVVQVNTGSGCHLDAEMIRGAVETLGPVNDSVVFVENVGNLVCPALFDLGEQGKVVLISVTEGDDKPLKYPHIFAVADLLIVNKTDLLPYVDFDPESFEQNARSVNPTVRVVYLSATSGKGIEHWYGWIADRRREPIVRR